MKYDLVFEGGGAEGMALVGAYEELVRRNHTHGRLLGTSAGVITATLVAAGFTPEEMLAMLNERENGKPVFAGFMGTPKPFSRAEIQSSAIRSLLRDINLKFVPDIQDSLPAVAGIVGQSPG
jgi:predicted acylesterase/phospholipase RssA